MHNIAERGRQASVDGFAHEHIAAGILMKRYQNVSLVDLPLSPYDIIIVRRTADNSEDIIRAQVKTATQSVPFTGGGRGGVDRTYKSDVKTYTQSTATSDVVIGVHPTILIEELNQKSISIKKIKDLKENYTILENCKDRKVVIDKCREYGILSSESRYLFSV
ncbi:hypothetical protein F4167_15925 [Candidatus Poribacteria bacterium]|nr:hypothetical protein [Candidatus Poribacteria bacterium]